MHQKKSGQQLTNPNIATTGTYLHLKQLDVECLLNLLYSSDLAWVLHTHIARKSCSEKREKARRFEYSVENVTNETRPRMRSQQHAHLSKRSGNLSFVTRSCLVS